MAGKKATEKESSSWVGKVEDYSRKIWLAGLGVYSKIDTDGSRLFESLVKDGEKAEKMTKKALDKQVDGVEESVQSVRSRVGGVKDRALGKWSELEEAFDKRLNGAISRLGVPSRIEVQGLHSKVDHLTRQIEKLTGDKVTPIAAKPALKATPKTAAKPLSKTATTKAAEAKPAAKSTTKTTAARKPAVRKTVAAKLAEEAKPELGASSSNSMSAPAPVASPAPEMDTPSPSLQS